MYFSETDKIIDYRFLKNRLYRFFFKTEYIVFSFKPIISVFFISVFLSNRYIGLID